MVEVTIKEKLHEREREVWTEEAWRTVAKWTVLVVSAVLVGCLFVPSGWWMEGWRGLGR